VKKTTENKITTLQCLLTTQRSDFSVEETQFCLRWQGKVKMRMVLGC